MDQMRIARTRHRANTVSTHPQKKEKKKKTATPPSKHTKGYVHTRPGSLWCAVLASFCVGLGHGLANPVVRVAMDPRASFKNSCHRVFFWFDLRRGGAHLGGGPLSKMGFPVKVSSGLARWEIYDCESVRRVRVQCTGLPFGYGVVEDGSHVGRPAGKRTHAKVLPCSLYQTT